MELFPITVPILGAYCQKKTKPREWISYSFEDFSIHYPEPPFEEPRFQTNTTPSLPWFMLANATDPLGLCEEENKLLCLPYLKDLWRRTGVLFYRHQIETVENVIYSMQGNAILADEVGLGKTIEAGLILKEYLLRNLVKRALILTPAALCNQWYFELQEKLAIHAQVQRNPQDLEYADILIMSLDTAKKLPYVKKLQNTPYDLVIVDEAHRLKNSSSLAYKLLWSLQKTYCLLLTATPIQNSLRELYNLITVVRPGQLGSYSQFKKKYTKGSRQAKNTKELKCLVAEVMIRNKRSESTVVFTKRIIHPLLVRLSPPERSIYEKVTELVKHLMKTTYTNPLPLITLQREVCSTFYAAAKTLEAMQKKLPEPLVYPLLQEMMDTQLSSKCDLLEELLPTLKDKVIIFTEYKASQNYIRYRLEKKGFSTIGFDGTLSRGQKLWASHLFQREKQILVSTESGGEGQNLQFCHVLVNFDLPWNPMRLEQRIGRIHRLGQEKDVTIYNLITQNTIEEHVMHLLQQKIHMFQSVLGELDSILLSLEGLGALEKQLLEIFLKTEKDEADTLQDRVKEGKHSKESLFA